ncbi:MAG: sigma-70 family RNA polymerase sigma factor [Bacteroidales bacterium]|nr:sigma-70 family RNA polymerase sigma factor [Bacteroidales bacterium]
MNRILDDRDLAERCNRGDRQAEDELYRRYAAKIYTLCRRYIGDDEDAKDLMHDALIKALDKIDTFNYSGDGSLYSWIRKIAINMAINHIKRHRWRIVALEDGLLQTSDLIEDDNVTSIPHEVLLGWITSLPDVRRAVFNLYCIDGYTHSEIASMLGISEKGSAGILAQARKQLKEKIRRYLKEA